MNNVLISNPVLPPRKGIFETNLSVGYEMIFFNNVAHEIDMNQECNKEKSSSPLLATNAGLL